MRETLLLVLLAACLMGGGRLLWLSVATPEDEPRPYDWTEDWALALAFESETVDALIAVYPQGEAPPKTWSKINEEELWLT